jgi:hypothetical protein
MEKMKPMPRKQSPRQSAVERIYGMVQKVASPTGGTIGKLPKRDWREAKPMPRGRIQGVVYQGTPGPKGNYPTVTNKQAARAADRYGIKAPTVGVKANVMQARADRNGMPLVQFDKNKQPLRDANGDYVMAPPRNPAKAARQQERALIYGGKENAWVEGATSKRIKKHYGSR